MNKCLASPDNFDVRELERWGVPKGKAGDMLLGWGLAHHINRHDVCDLYLTLRDDLVVKHLPFWSANSALQRSLTALGMPSVQPNYVEILKHFRITWTWKWWKKVLWPYSTRKKDNEDEE